jgi:hypothetical protein
MCPFCSFKQVNNTHPARSLILLFSEHYGPAPNQTEAAATDVNLVFLQRLFQVAAKILG